MQSYCGLQKINAPELLSLYLNYDLLEEAALLVIEYIDAILGNGNEYFGLQVLSSKCTLLFCVCL